MEVTRNTPTEIKSSDSEMMYATIGCLNKKRKFPAEQLGMPLAKQKCSSNYGSGCASSSNASPKGFYPSLIEEGGFIRYSSEPAFREDSNSSSADDDSVMSICGEVKNDLQYLKVMSSDHPSTSSVTRGNHSSEERLYSLEGRAMTRTGSDKMKSLYAGAEKDQLPHDFESHSSPEYDDHLLELGCHEDYSYPEYGAETMEPYPKELEELLYSNGVTPSNYVLSSGRWTVKQDADQGPKKLTIDKEFEEYFSTLML